MRRALFALLIGAAQADDDDVLRGLRFTPITERSPSPHLSLTPVTAVPGLWRASGATKGHGMGHWRVSNTGAARVGLPAQTLVLRWDRHSLPARCSLLQREPELAPGASADWVCALDAPVPADLQGAARWDLAPPLVLLEALLPKTAAAPAPVLRERAPRAAAPVPPPPAPAPAAPPAPKKSDWSWLGVAFAGLLAVLAFWVWRATRRSAPALVPSFYAPTPAPTPAARRLRCPHCRAPFAHLRLAGHYGAQVELDHCDACRLLWFDGGELARLSAPGWTSLLQHLVAHAGGRPAQPARADAACPHCDVRLRSAHDQTLFGRFTGLVCPQGHGSAQRDAAVFAARGLFRRLHGFEAGRLQGEAAGCLACGAPRSGGDGGDCSYCGSPPLVVDLHRLAQSLGLQQRRSTLGQGQALLWRCAGCGQAVDAVAHSACPQCAHPVLAQRLDDVRPLIEAAASRPPPTLLEQQAERRASVEALLAHERMKADWARGARPRSPAMRLLLGAVRLLGRRE